MRTLVVILSLFLIAAQNGRDWQFGSTTLDTKTFANLGPENDGQVKWCPDCQSTNPCFGAGTGAFAFGQHGAWNCAAASGVIGPTGPTGPGGSPSGPAGGDLSGSFPNPTVAKEQGHPFDAINTPQPFNFMLFEADGVNATWQYQNPATAGGDSLLNGSGQVSYYIYDLLNGQTGGITAKGAIPVVSDTVSTDAAAVIAAGAAGTTLNGCGPACIPGFGSPPLVFRGGSNAVLPDNTNAYVFPFDGVGTPVQTTSEGTVLTIFSSTYNSRQIRCGLYNAAGVLTSPSPGTETCAIRKLGVTQTTSNCTISTAATCNTVATISFSAGNTGDYICTPANLPLALIPKCSSQGF